MKHITRLLFAMAALAALVCFSTPTLHADTAPPEVAAEVVADAAPAAHPWYADGAFIGGIIAAFTSIVAIWQNKGKKTAQKVSESLVQAIEVATRIPAVAEKEKEIKRSINATVTKLGVQPLVHRIVKDVTL